MSRYRLVLIVTIMISGLLLIPISSEGQDTQNPVSPPQIGRTYDSNWTIFNAVTIGEKSCITVKTLSQFLNRCFDGADVKISDTVALPNGNLGGDMFVTRISVSNGVECLVTTSSIHDYNGSIVCSNDIHSGS